MLLMNIMLTLTAPTLISNKAFAISFPPSFLEQPPKLVPFVVNEAVKLPCKAKGSPSPTYQWYRNDELLDLFSMSDHFVKYPDEGTLINLRPELNDEAIYQCVAKNAHGTAYSVKSVLKAAQLQKFINLGTTIKNVNRGNSEYFLCHVPSSYPPATIRWFMANNGKSTIIQEDNGKVLDVEGSLYFAQVTREDATATYQCTAYNSVTRSMMFGSDNRFNLLNQNHNRFYPVSVLFRSEQNVTTLIGKSVQLRCIFGGNPLPSIQWIKEDTAQSIDTLPYIKLYGMGAILEITNITSRHEGAYLCTAKNNQSVNSQHVNFNLMLKSEPFWRIQPRDVSVAVGTDYVFQCKAGGDPIPNIRWYLNGIPFASNSVTAKKYISEHGDLTLKKLKVEDSMVVQCNASNTFGYIFANAYLNVLSEPPEFIVPPQKYLKVAENQSVYLTCQTFSAPPAFITWFRDKKVLSEAQGHYRLQTNGDIFIERVLLTDSGVYQCHAENKFGSRSAKGELNVRQRTRITVTPKNVNIFEGQEVNLDCVGTTDPLEMSNLKIEWYKAGSFLSSKSLHKYTDQLIATLSISDAEPKDTGQYQCVADNLLDNETAMAHIVVQGRPDKVSSLMADCDQKSGKALVTWLPGNDNFAPVQTYKLQFSTQWQPEVWYHAAKVQADQSKNSVVKGTVLARITMRPFIKYLFRVIAKNIVGDSEPSNVSLLLHNECQLAPAPPSANPTRLHVEGDRMKHLLIQWSAISPLDYNGKNVVYLMEISCMNCKKVPANQVNTTVVLNPLQERLSLIEIVFENKLHSVEIFKSYRVRMTTHNEIGICGLPAIEKIGYSGEGVPIIKPLDFRLTSSSTVGSDTVKLAWTEPEAINDDDMMLGLFRGYRIEWCLASLSITQCKRTKRFKDVIINIASAQLHQEQKHRVSFLRERQAFLTHLPGATSIKIWVRVINRLYAGPKSNIIEVKTLEGTPGPVSEFALCETGVNQLTFDWTPPIQTNGKLIGYQLGFKEINGLELGPMIWVPEINDPMQTRSYVSDLKSNTNYRVFLWARTSKGKGEVVFLDVRTASPDVAPVKPTFSVVNIADNAFNVSFLISNSMSANIFYVQYRQVGGKWEETQREHQSRWIVVANLKINSWYELRVVSINGAALTTYSEQVKVKTGLVLNSQAPYDSKTTITWIVIALLMILCTLGALIFVCCISRRRRRNYLRGQQISGDSQNDNASNTYNWAALKTNATIESDHAAALTEFNSYDLYLNGDIVR